MDLRVWDSEVANLKRDLSMLDKSLGISNIQVSRLMHKKKRVLQSELRFRSNLDILKKTFTKDYLLKPHERAILYWSQLYLEKLRNFYDLKKKYLIKNFWLKLLRARILGCEVTEKELHFDLDAADIVALGLRHAQLQKVEQQLEDRVVLIDQRKKDLKDQYEQLDIIESNNIAARSFYIRFARIFDRESMFSSLRTIGRGLINASLILRKDEKYHEFSEDLHTLNELTEETLISCQSFLVDKVHSASNDHQFRHQDHLKEAIVNISAVEDKVRKSYDKIAIHSSPRWHPIVVQKVENPDKKGYE